MGLLIALWTQARRLGTEILSSGTRHLQRLLEKPYVSTFRHKSACI